MQPHHPGANVVLVGRDPDTLAQAQELLGDGALVDRGDGTLIDDLDRLFTAAQAASAASTCSSSTPAS